MTPALANTRRLLAEAHAELEAMLREDGDYASLAELAELTKPAPPNATPVERSAALERLVQETREELEAIAREESWPFP